MTGVIATCRAFLKQKHITVPDEWISACLEWIRSENPNINVNGQHIVQQMYDQWLYSDLTELATVSLPFGLAQKRCTSISGYFPLQVNKVQDIGNSAYSQLQKIRKDDTENLLVSADEPRQAAWEPKPSRLLLLQMTDGTSIVEGMEYKPIPALSVSLTPGIKILVSGTVKVRRGILFLTHQNVSVLGGEVESLLVPNALENVLSHVLGGEETNHPRELEPSAQATQVAPSQASQYYPSQLQVPQQPVHPQGPTTVAAQQKQPVHSERRLTTSCQRESSFGAQNDCALECDFNDDDIFDEEIDAVLSRVAVQDNTRQEECRNMLANQQAVSSAFSDGFDVSHGPTGHTSGSSFVRMNQPHGKNSSTGTFVANAASDSFKTHNSCFQTYEVDTDDVFGDDPFQDDLCEFPDDIPNVDIDNKQSNVVDKEKQPTRISSGYKNGSLRKGNEGTQFTFSTSGIIQTQGTVQQNKRDNNSLSMPFEQQVLSLTGVDEFPDDDFASITEHERWPVPLQSSSTNSSNEKSCKRPQISSAHHTVADLQNTFVVESLGNSNHLSDESTVGQQLSKQQHVSGFTNNDILRAGQAGTSVSETNSGLWHSKQRTVTSSVRTLPPFTYLCFLPEKPQVEEIYTVKGFVMTLKTRLMQLNGAWQLTVTINDGTSSRDVDIDNKVLCDLIGMSVEEMAAKKMESAAEFRSIFSKCVVQCQQKLISLCALLHLQVNPSFNLPRICAIEPINSQHVEQLAKRNSSNL